EVRRDRAGLLRSFGDVSNDSQAFVLPARDGGVTGLREPIRRVELLVLDDLGASKPSAWVLDIIGLVLNARYNERRVTILTTNYFDEKPVTEPAPRLPNGQRVVVKEDSLGDRTVARMRSRLYELGRTVEIFAPDFRREVRQSTRARA